VRHIELYTGMKYRFVGVNVMAGLHICTRGRQFLQITDIYIWHLLVYLIRISCQWPRHVGSSDGVQDYGHCHLVITLLNRTFPFVLIHIATG
jgi:hypothetical protein